MASAYTNDPFKTATMRRVHLLLSSKAGALSALSSALLSCLVCCACTRYVEFGLELNESARCVYAYTIVRMI
jgi:hypothetical protein